MFGHFYTTSNICLFITLQYIPAPDQLNRLKEYEKDYDSLAEAEQFAISLADIKRLVPRLKSLKFQLHYPELVQDCKPDIVAATEACQEVSALTGQSEQSVKSQKQG